MSDNASLSKVSRTETLAEADLNTQATTRLLRTLVLCWEAPSSDLIKTDGRGLLCGICFHSSIDQHVIAERYFEIFFQSYRPVGIARASLQCLNLAHPHSNGETAGKAERDGWVL
jgi:hypothetical protein